MNEPKDRPYVICHMQTSIDGRISGKFFFTPAADAIYEIVKSEQHRAQRNADAMQTLFFNKK